MSTNYFSEKSDIVAKLVNKCIMASLPDDILYMICSQLWKRRDFDTLYHCVCAGKQLAVPALTNLYRYPVALALKKMITNRFQFILANYLQHARRGSCHERWQR